MSKMLPIDVFKSVENRSQFNKDFISHYNQVINKGYFLKVDVHCSDKLHDFRMIFYFNLTE